MENSKVAKEQRYKSNARSLLKALNDIEKQKGSNLQTKSSTSSHKYDKSQNQRHNNDCIPKSSTYCETSRSVSNPADENKTVIYNQNEYLAARQNKEPRRSNSSSSSRNPCYSRTTNGKNDNKQHQNNLSELESEYSSSENLLGCKQPKSHLNIFCTDTKGSSSSERQNVIKSSSIKIARSTDNCISSSNNHLAADFKCSIKNSNVASKSGTALVTMDEEIEPMVLCELNNEKPERHIYTALNDHIKIRIIPNQKQRIQNLFQVSSFESSNNLSNVDDLLANDTDSVIPPPVLKLPASGEPDICETQKSSFNDVTSPMEDFSMIDSETNPFMELDSKQLERVTDYIGKVFEEKYVASTRADQIVRDLNILFKNELEGNTIDIYGSFYADLAISTSDINLYLKSDISIRKKFMYEVYKVLHSDLNKYNVLPYEVGDSASQTKIQFCDPVSGFSCQLVYLGKNEPFYKEMGRLLKCVSNHDDRIKMLIIAVKVWAEICLINEVEEGKLHPIGYIMMVIHFLQHYKKPLLPIPIYFHKNWVIENCLSPSDSSVGELWIEFLKYYAFTFNWSQNVVTIISKNSVTKKSKGWENVWMAIEDPYSGKNIARSVENSDVANSIKTCFRASYEYFCSPLKNEVSDSTEENAQSDGNLSSQNTEFSFQQCIVDVSICYCEACDELDDVCNDCQKKIYVAPMASVPAMTEEFLIKIRESLNFIYGKYILTENEVKERENFVCDLQKSLRFIYPKVELHLFGSSANGFGFKNSDLDICITLTGDEAKNTTSMIRGLRSHLRKNTNFDHLIAIFSAQIPILKFHYKPKGWRGDICVNNSLAVYNSRLLYSYSRIDERCRILGCALKLLAKKALISEVTEKALSSYSYLIMLIHFLQQTDPPVLPVLQDQKFHEDEVKMLKVNDVVDGWNVWYYKGTDFKKEPLKNNTPVEQLWLDLLDYYCSFDKMRYITIRQKEPLFLNEKHIPANLFNIQDPFIEVKNLGKVVSAKKAKETESVLRRARYLFRNPVTEFPSGPESLENYFFSTMSLTGRIHKEAHCDMCGQYGHELKDCKHNFPSRKFPPRRYKPVTQRKKFFFKN